MKQIPIVEWEDKELKLESEVLLRLPYIDLDTIDLVLTEAIKQKFPLYGLISSYSEENVEFNVRCAARIKDRFPKQLVYIAVPKFKTYDKLKTIARAGFRYIVIPQYLGGVEYDHYFQFVEGSVLDNLVLHVAGGKFSSDTWNKEGWTWSKEML